ncbi:hypothetical protein NUH87_10780 [Pseudomonas batumici]|uniref:hypothetical protein n=1 Tax=Pseudomonas batumici TaxID=226910 RepID=UPI0030D1E994
MSALNPADKRKILLLEFIFFDIKVPCYLPEISLISPPMSASGEKLTGTDMQKGSIAPPFACLCLTFAAITAT